MNWVKEFHGAREFGWRREDDLAYVGKSAGKWWRVYVRANLDDGFGLLSRHGWASDRSAMQDADQWVDGKVGVAA